MKARVIVIDDREPIRRIIRRALEHEGYDGLLRRTGAARTLDKPFTARDVTALVEEVLQSRP